MCFLREIQKIKYPAVFVIGCARRLLVLVPNLKGWATAGYFITGKCLRNKAAMLKGRESDLFVLFVAGGAPPLGRS